MGREARLREKGLLAKHTSFIVAIKVDFSYEIEQEVDGKKVVEKVENFFFYPLGETMKFVSSFKTEKDADDFLKVIASEPKSPKDEQIFMTKDFHILEVRYTPLEKKQLKVDWAKKYIVRDIQVDIKKKKSSKLI